MRRLTGACVVFGLAGTAFGGSYTLNFAGGGSEIWTAGSQYADIEVWLHLDAAPDSMSSFNTDLVATYVPAPAGFTVEAVTPGPLIGWLADPPAGNFELNGWISAGYANVDPDYYIVGPADVLLYTIRIHDTGIIGDQVIGFDTSGARVNEYALADFSTIVQATLGPSIILHTSIPEPAALALLVLGGGMLLGRRR